jgi:2-polyprenyl-6-methoxyphenol hydroxylase-like FAD-dependent oxidoreductase
MKILVSGAGIAGLSLSLCLERGGGGHELTIIEKSPTLRDEGYMIDFFGSGYDAAEKMGLIPDLEGIHYPIPRLAFVDAQGREKYSIAYSAFRRLLDDRHFNFMRGDLERVLYSKIQERLSIRFGMTVESFRQDEQHVDVRFSDGTAGRFDLLVGADGVHSQIRALEFGAEERFSRFLGYYTAAFMLGAPPRTLGATDAFYTMTVPGRQVGVYPIRGDRIATFFVHKARRSVPDLSRETAINELSTEYGGMGWIVPEILERCDVPSLYFDRVSQIEMPRWSEGRVVLLGDACQCVSLLAGQGASMAMAGAYVLAEALGEYGNDIPGALGRYEAKLKPSIEKKQQAGRRIAKWFVPENAMQLAIRDTATRMAEWPIAWRLLKRFLAPESIFRS